MANPNIDMSDKRKEIVQQIESIEKKISKIREECESEVALLENKSNDLKHELYKAQQIWDKKH